MQPLQSPTRPPRRPLPGWTTVLIPLLFAGGAVLAHFQEPSSLNEQSMGGATPQPTATSSLEPRPIPTSQSQKSPSSMAEVEVSYVVLIPRQDGKLHRHTFPYKIKPTEEPTAPSTIQEQEIGRALTKLFQTAPDYFPKRTKVVDVQVPGLPDKPILVDMGAGFADEEFWQGEEATTTTLDAIVNTAVANSDKDNSNQKVLFQVDGKPLVTLGQMDMRDPLSADPEAVANS